MDMKIIKKAMKDELNKIAQISLMSLSPGSILSARSASPFETPGASRAMEAIRRSSTLQPQLITPPPQEKTAEHKLKKITKKYVGPGLMGGGSGALIGGLIPHGKPGQTHLQYAGVDKRLRLGGALIGAGIAILTKQSMTSPAMTLSASQRVGTVVNKLKAGPKVSTQIRGSLVGQKGTIPGV